MEDQPALAGEFATTELGNYLTPSGNEAILFVEI
jgi:hypothetical protein